MLTISIYFFATAGSICPAAAEAIAAAAIAAGGTVVLLGMTEAQLLGLGGGALTGIASYLGCDYCSTHNCVVNRFDPGEDLKEVVSVKLKGQCPIPKG